MKRSRNLVKLAGRLAACFLAVNLTVPTGAIVLVGEPIRDAAENAQKGVEAKRKVREARAKTPSRPMTASEMRKKEGRTGADPYLAGQQKWDIVYQGVNLMTGSLTLSANDAKFEGGYGVPISVVRSYNSNSVDEGPMGRGWNLSTDLRSTAGGLLKSKAAPVRSVPATIQERAATERDPNVPASSQPIEAVVATDASGETETIQKDADGILTTPPWDDNQMDYVYEPVEQNGNLYWVLLSNRVVTPEGTVYEYAKKGTYLNGGTRPYNDSTATPEPANVLKPTSVTDRQGNVTTFTYGPSVTFAKSSGTVSEAKLTEVTMPNGQKLRFFWTGNRITEVRDGADADRTRWWTYEYTGGMLTRATTPGGMTTDYEYGDSEGMLTKITDPAGLVTTVAYGDDYLCNALQQLLPAHAVHSITYPNGTYLAVRRYMASPVGTLPEAWVTYQIDPGHVISGFKCRSLVEGGSIVSQALYANGAEEAGNLGSVEYRKYDIASMQLTSTESLTTSAELDTLEGVRGLGDPYHSTVVGHTYTSSAVNFLGQPLWEQSNIYNGSSSSVTRTLLTQYAYWGKDKYYQRKATVDPFGRASVTDYYPNTASTGSKGQTKAIYNEQFVAMANKPDANNAATWRAAMLPANLSRPAATMEYDAKGRATKIFKVRTGGTTSALTYVETRTAYNDGPLLLGNAASVTEDYGGINRTTSTGAVDFIGRPKLTTDALGQQFRTHRNEEGQAFKVVKEAGPGLLGTMSEYEYAPAVMLDANGQTVRHPDAGRLLHTKDGISGITNDIAYYHAGPGIGQPSQFDEHTEIEDISNGHFDDENYNLKYAYNLAGDRWQTEFTSSTAHDIWEYADYVSVGTPTSQSRVSQTLRKLDANTGLPTKEELHYAYDAGGRLKATAFAQFPKIMENGSEYVPSGNNPYYDASHPPSSRALATYEYAATGELLGLRYWTEQGLGTPNWTPPVEMLNDVCNYDARGRKQLSTIRRYDLPTNLSPVVRDESYTYNDLTDRLISATVVVPTASGTSTTSSTKNWSYDAAGNRQIGSQAATYDALNRLTQRGSLPYGNDILGNRTSRGTGTNQVTYDWDPLNRLSVFTTSLGVDFENIYRADGLRAAQARKGTRVSAFRYDGQSCAEESVLQMVGGVEKRGSIRHITGPRGVEMTSTKEWNSTTGYADAFAAYDAHGNQVATIRRTSAGGHSLGDVRGFGAWGDTVSGTASGRPYNKHSANLGHREDEDSGLVYMRARFYEPETGMFVSEDPARDGLNWFSYCAGDPVNNVDQSGEETLSQAFMIAAIGTFFSTLGAWLINAMTSQKVDLYKEALGLAVKCFWSAMKSADDKALSKADLVAKMQKEGIFQFQTGLSVGVVLAIYAGVRAGQVMAELFYIDHSDEITDV